MQYYSIHPPSFLSDYDAWWIARQNGSAVCASWTGLLLQVCANAVKTADPALRQQLQYDLAESEDEASLRFVEAAKSLNDTIPAGVGGVNRVTQLLLTAAWLKREGQIVDGWHALSIAVRQAQECGE